MALGVVPPEMAMRARPRRLTAALAESDEQLGGSAGDLCAAGGDVRVISTGRGMA